MTAYVKTLSKRQEGDDKEKILPVAYLGSTMVNHGEDFEDDSEFGQCLMSERAMLLRPSPSRLRRAQVWAGRTNALVAFKRPTLQTRLQAGLNRSRDPLHR